MNGLTKKTLNVKAIIYALFLLAVVALGIVYVQRPQDIRNKAALSGSVLSMNPSSATQATGTAFRVGILLNAGPDSVTAAELHLAYDPQLLQITGFEPGRQLPVVLTPVKFDSGAMSVTLGAQPSAPLRGSDVIGTILVKSLTNNPATITFTPATNIAALDKPTNALASSTGISINKPVTETRCSLTNNGSPCTYRNCPTMSPCPSGAECAMYKMACTQVPGTCMRGSCVPQNCVPRPSCLDAVGGVDSQFTRRCVAAPLPAGATYCPPTPKPTPVTCDGPNGSTCTMGACPTCPPGQPCPKMLCKLQTGICQNKICTVQTAPPGCFYQQVKCIQAPCNPILVCPTPSCTMAPQECYDKSGNLALCDPPPGVTWCHPTVGSCAGQPNGTACKRCKPCTSQVCPMVCIQESGTCQSEQCVVTPTVSPTTVSCVRRAPSVVITPEFQSGKAGTTVRYSIAFTNNDSTGCERTDFTLRSRVDTGWTTNVNGTVITNIYPGNGATVNFDVTSSATAAPNATPYPVTAYVKNNASQQETEKSAAYTVVPQTQAQSLEFRVKLAGVTNNAAEGAKIAVKFVKSDGTTVALSQPLTLSHIGNGVYKAIASLSNPLAAGTKYTVKIKGEKHVSVKFCKVSGQTAACQGEDFITVPSAVPASYVYDFTGIALPPGDLSTQDGVVDNGDFQKLKERMSKTHASLTAADLAVADLNYDGWIDSTDAYLLAQTVNTRHDE